MTIPGLREAKMINQQLKAFGIKDVELMYDTQINMWAVMQVFKPSGKILLLNDPKHYETQPILMFWIKNQDGTYRTPAERDLSDIIVIVKRAQVTFEKGSDWMIDKMEKEEQEKYDKNRQAQSERIRSFAKPMKKAIRKELT